MEILKITQDNFDQEVLQSDKPVMIDLWASWCGPCMMLAPVISEIAEEYEGKIKVGKINVDEEMDLARSFGVTSIPMVVVVKGGKVTNSIVGYRPKEEIVRILD